MPPTNVPDEITQALTYIKGGIVRNGEGLKSLAERTDEFESCVDGLQRTASQLRKRALQRRPSAKSPEPLDGE